jgi:hypothetical protein
MTKIEDQTELVETENSEVHISVLFLTKTGSTG